MKKSFVFWMLLACALAAVASMPVMHRAKDRSLFKQKPALPAFVNQFERESTLPARIIADESGVLRRGRDALDVVDSSMFIDSLEGTYPAWTSQDLAVGDFWHLEGFNALGGSGNAFRCSDDRLADLCPPQNGGYNNHWLQYLVFDAVNLAGATSPQFACKAWWGLEGLDGATAPYNMWDGWNAWASSDGGATWTVLEPSAPDMSPGIPATNYSQTSAFSFGDEWDMGPNIPAFGDTSGHYFECIFPLTAYIGQASVKVRVAFCSDPAFCTADDGNGVPQCDRWGLVVDSVRISDGASTLLSNDGVAGGWVTETGPQSPDTWLYDTSTNHSPTHCWTAGIANNLSRAIVSYPVILPAGYQNLKMYYWVWCDMPDFEGPDTNTFLEDYYQMYVSTNDGATWTQVRYDYATDNGEDPPGGDSYAGWVYRTQGLTAGAYNPMVIFSRTTATVNETLRVAFELTTDGDDDGGAGGTGVHIDDIQFVAQRAQAVDLTARNIVVPQPVTVGLARPWMYDLVNEGLNGSVIRSKFRFQKPDSTFIPATADCTANYSGVLNYGDDTTVTRPWVGGTGSSPSVTGAWRIRVIANNTSDMDHTNDTTQTAINATQNDDSTLAVYARPANNYELGYGRRGVGNAYLNPRYIHYQPVADGVPGAAADTIDIYQLRVMWRYDAQLADTGGRVRIDLWSEGVDSFHTGPLVNSVVTRIDTSETIGDGGFIHWWEFDLSVIPGFNTYVGPGGNFWLSITQLDSFVIDGELTPAPLPLGISPAGVAPDARTYFLDPLTGILNQSGGRLLVNVIIRPAINGAPLASATLTAIRRLASGANNVVLDWLPVAGATGYKVYRMTSATQLYSAGTLLTPLPITGTTFTDTGVVPTGALRFYQILAVN